MAEDKLDPNTLMEKAEISDENLPNSVLNREQSDRFIDMVVDYSTLLKQVRVNRVSNQHGEINKLDLGHVITEGANIPDNPFKTSVPSEKMVTYQTVKYRAGFDLGTDFTEDNLEGNGIRDTLLNMFSKQVSLDTERAFIEGDEAISPTSSSSALDKLLGVNNGILKILNEAGTSLNPGVAADIDAGGTASSKKLFYDMKRQVPKRYRSILNRLYRYIVPTSVYDKWEYDLTKRNTREGDAALDGYPLNSPLGIYMTPAPMLPEDLGTSENKTTMFLSPLQNLLYFIQRDITIEWERKPREDKWEFTLHYRCDFQVENREMVVKASDLYEDGVDYGTT